MKEISILFVCTRWRAQSHQWVIGDDDLVEYRGERIPPSQVPERFIVDYPMFDMLRAEVCQRINVEGQSRPFEWIDVERFA